ncbi:MAG TPA: outer membrane beta-barrel protein [Acidobacteriaceae bacterium]|nr:outer membrane beta-barrel protein [Acidobacteriaceae bacterium]
MKKLFFLLCLLPALASVGFAQASRQDLSASFVGTVQPTIYGNAVTQTSSFGKGILLGYRFMLTPSSALQANIQYTRFTTKFVAPFAQASIYGSMEEGSVSYVRSFIYKKFNPFVEGGAALLLFTPIDNTHTTTNAGSRSKAPAGVFGGGIAYELSPSWDLRVEYRAYLAYANDFGLSQYKTDRYEYFINQPTIGFAYHF